jgi:hypothetical protein
MLLLVCQEIVPLTFYFYFSLLQVVVWKKKEKAAAESKSAAATCSSAQELPSPREHNPNLKSPLKVMTLEGLPCQFYGTNTFETFYPDPSKHKFCPDGTSNSALVLVQKLPECIFKLADRSFANFNHTDLQTFFNKHLPASIRRPKCKVGVFEVSQPSINRSVRTSLQSCRLRSSRASAE